MLTFHAVTYFLLSWECTEGGGGWRGLKYLCVCTYMRRVSFQYMFHVKSSSNFLVTVKTLVDNKLHKKKPFQIQPTPGLELREQPPHTL